MADFGSLPHIGGSASIGDIVNALFGGASHLQDIFGPLQKQSADILGGVLSGGQGANDILNRLAGPGIAGIEAQTPNVLRQITDTLPAGGARAQGMSNAFTGAQGDIAKMLSGLQSSLIGTAVDTGLGLSQQELPFLSGAGALRVGEKGAKGRGKK